MFVGMLVVAVHSYGDFMGGFMQQPDPADSMKIQKPVVPPGPMPTAEASFKDRMSEAVKQVTSVLSGALDRVQLVEQKLGVLEAIIGKMEAPTTNDIQRLSYLVQAVDQAAIPLAESFLALAVPVINSIDFINTIAKAAAMANKDAEKQAEALRKVLELADFTAQIKSVLPVIKPALAGVQSALPVATKTLEKFGGKI